jgi:hypothetical protein
MKDEIQGAAHSIRRDHCAASGSLRLEHASASGDAGLPATSTVQHFHWKTNEHTEPSVDTPPHA